MTPGGRRLEELTLNSSTPPGQLLYDGWLLRRLPGKAKRPRSVNALYPSTLPLAQKIAHCERLYGEAGLPALFRITPFCQPGDLDAVLEDRGYGRFDDTLVESVELGRGPPPAGGAEPLTLAAFVDAVGDLRGSSQAHRAAHRERLEGLGLPLQGVAMREAGNVVATGLVVMEGEHAGLFDIVTAEGARRRGFARGVVASLLARAREAGAGHAYLQVQADNDAARRLYRAFGFEERYVYWYRGRPGEQR